MPGLNHRVDVVTSPSPAIVIDLLWADDSFFPSTGIAFTDLPVSTTIGSPLFMLLGTDWGGVWWYLQVQGVESGHFPNQGYVLCCLLEGTSKGVPAHLFLSSSKAWSSSMTHSEGSDLWHFQ